MFIPNEIQKIITNFAYGTDETFQDLAKSFKIIEDVNNCIPNVFLAPVTFDGVSNTFIPNPYRESFPFHSLKHLYRNTIFSNLVTFIPEFLRSTYYKNKYKGCIMKKCVGLQQNGLKSWNKVYFSFFSKLTEEDFLQKHKNLFSNEFKFLLPLNLQTCRHSHQLFRLA